MESTETADIGVVVVVIRVVYFAHKDVAVGGLAVIVRCLWSVLGTLVGWSLIEISCRGVLVCMSSALRQQICHPIPQAVFMCLDMSKSRVIPVPRHADYRSVYVRHQRPQSFTSKVAGQELAPPARVQFPTSLTLATASPAAWQYRCQPNHMCSRSQM